MVVGTKYRDLAPPPRRGTWRAPQELCLSETDVAADDAIHRPAAGDLP
jgi:hypothetical protein